MKVLLLSCNTGEGHHSAALAVEAELQSRNIPCQLADPMSFASDATRDRVCNAYNSLIRNLPKAFGLIYKAGERADGLWPHSPIYLANSLYADKLLAYIRENQFDTVISTHLFGMEAMTAIAKKFGVHIPTYAVLTDYTCIPFFTDVKMDGYFIPHKDLIPELTQKGLDAAILYPTGIPVSPKFAQRLEMTAARERLSLPAEKKIYLVMTGGAGCGHISDLCQELREWEREDFLACVLVGKNDKMRDELDAQFGDDPRICPVGFTREVNVYMNAADVLITKPGGLSSTEAAAACVPMIHLITIPGCEEYNAAFYAAHGMSRPTEDPRQAARLAVELAHDAEACRNMRLCQLREINPCSARDLVDKVLLLENA